MSIGKCCTVRTERSARQNGKQAHSAFKRFLNTDHPGLRPAMIFSQAYPGLTNILSYSQLPSTLPRRDWFPLPPPDVVRVPCQRVSIGNYWSIALMPRVMVAAST